MVIRLDYNLYDELIEYAKNSLPEEACGLIAGIEDEGIREIKKIYYLENVDHADDHFTIEPKNQMAAIKDMRANGYKPLGNWHSHPESPSRPSEEDVKLAYVKDASYLILSLMGKYPVLNAYHIENGEWTKEDFRIVSEDYKEY